MQIEIDFDAGLTQTYTDIMQVINAVVRTCGRPLKAVAADLDRSPSDLSRWLSYNPDEPRRLPVEALPLLIDACGDRGKQIVHWLIERHLEDPETRRERARDVITELGPLLIAAMQEIQPDGQVSPIKGARNG